MRYVEFVQEFFAALLDEVHQAQTRGLPPMVMSHQAVARLFGKCPSAAGTTNAQRERAVAYAVHDLEGLLVVEGGPHALSLTRLGRHIAEHEGRLDALWPVIFEQTYLEADERTLLDLLAAATETRFDDVAITETVNVYLALNHAGIDWAIYRRIQAIKGLEAAGLLMGIMSSEPFMRPTYKGMVVVQERESTALQQLVGRILSGAETVYAEFKRQLNLDTRPGRLEFAKDVMALTNTQVGIRRRYLLVGVDNATRTRTANHDPRDDQERMERIVNAYLDRPPCFEAHVAPWDGGRIGLIIIDRDPLLIPHRWKRSVRGGLAAGAVKVRHGSQVEDPSPNELADLVAEGDAARANAAIARAPNP